MWQLLRTTVTQRERRTLLRKASSILTAKRSQHALALQLDYYMSPQFAGVASALVSGGYAKKGIDISFLPTCPVGLEQQNVRDHQDANPSMVTMGSVEQNIFIPLLASNPSLNTTAVAAMFNQSPLCLASLKDLSSGSVKVGAHEDTVELLQRVFPEHEVVASPRASKNTDLMSGDLGAIQAYTTTEVPTLCRKLGHEPVVTPLEGLNGTKLGYSQVLFAADECLEGDKRELVQAFLTTTFDGWSNAIHNPEQVAEMVREAKKILGLNDESNDHWYPSTDFEVEMLQKCDEYVKGTFEGDRYGVIDPDRWSQANDWLLQEKKKTYSFGLDANIWQPSAQLLPGNKLGSKILEEAKVAATSFKNSFSRKPSLAVITVGELDRYQDAKRRLQIYGQQNKSWFSKTSTGEANGFDVKEINLDASTTTEELLSQIYAQRDVDGIQLMWPLPDHIDSAKVYSAIKVEKDIDGIHFVGQREIGNKNAYPPVTPAAALTLIKENGIDAKGKRVLVVGKGTVVGSPIAQMLRDEGGAVTVAHSEIDETLLKNLVGEAEIIITCTGKPGLIKADWINDAVVINVGTTFQKELDKLVSDVDGDIAKHASKYSPVPGGIGPLSVPILFQNVAKAAWDQMNTNGVSA